MNASAIQAEFAASGVPAGEGLVYDDRTALKFISRAQEEGLAISAVEMVQPGEAGRIAPPRQRILADAERLKSWDQARSFIEMLAGRGLYFLVVIESPWSTRLARVRSVVGGLIRDQTSHPLP